MIRVFAALLLALWPVLSYAKPVPVQSGEHADFSRLVFLFGDVPDWRFGRVEGGYEFRPEGVQSGYDLSRVFEFIPRDRIAAIEPRAGGRLFVRLECDCHADAFEIRIGVVVDVKDGPAPNRAQFEAVLPKLRDEMATDNAATEPIAENGPIDPLRFIPIRTQHAWRDRIAMDFPDNETTTHKSLEPEPEPVRSTAEAVADAQGNLIAQIARASTQGLVLAEISDPTPPSEPVPKEEPIETTNNDGGAGDPDAQASPSEPLANIRIETAADHWLESVDNRVTLAGDRERCIASERLDIASWGYGAAGGLGLAEFRSEIVGEFDKADPASVEALAKAYIYLTFGAEAKALLSSFGANTSESAMYRAMADIMDDGVASRPKPFQGQLQCDGRAALWAALARPSLGGAKAVSVEDVLAAFAELPLHLRRHLGPRLAERFLQAGDTETASTIRNLIEQAPGDHGPGFDMIQADIALATGESSTAQQHLAGIVGGDGSLAPEALVKLIDARIEAGGEISNRELGSVQALEFEYRGTDQGGNLRRAEIRALIHRGAFLDAAVQLKDAALAQLLPPETTAVLRRELFGRAADTSGTAAFLRLATDTPLQLTGAADGPARRAVAQRFLDLGLPVPARTVLSESTGVPIPAERLLYAEASLMQGRPGLATGYLAGLSDEPAQRLRARAHEATNEYSKAAEIYTEIRDPSAQTTARWRAGDWDEVGDALPSALTRAAALALMPVHDTFDQRQPAPETMGAMARNRAILTHSQTARTALAELLAALPKP